MRRKPILWLAVAMTLISVAACGRGNGVGLIPPTATPPVPTAPRPTALPSPTPTPLYLGLVQADEDLPVGHLVFSTALEAEEGVQVWVRSQARDDALPVLEFTRDNLWDCAPVASFCVMGDETGEVYTFQPPDALSPLVPAGEDLQRAFVSPRGRFAGVVSGGFLALLDLQDPARVVHVPQVRAVGDVAWDGEDARLAFVAVDEDVERLFVMRLVPDLIPPALIAENAEVLSPAWAGTQRKMAFIVRGLDHPRGGTQRRDVFVSDLETDEYLNLTETFGPLIDWIPAQPFGAASLRWALDDETLDFVWVPPDERPDVGRVYRWIEGLDPQLVMAARLAPGQGWSAPVRSPDGASEAAVAAIESRGGAGELWVSPAGMESWGALSPSDQDVISFAWSPDGGYLAYVVDGDGIWVVPAAGGEARRVVRAASPIQVRRLQWLGGVP
ncbi:MAG: hypothetical protein Kow0047_07500 [Anaerolineae bacterium]